MSGKIKGSIEHFVSVGNAATGSAQSTFTAIFNLLSNAGDVGIQRLAYNTGSAVAGSPSSGTGYFDAATPFGSNAFACFRFLSASCGPFDFLIQWASTTAGFGSAPGNPAVLPTNPVANGCMAIAGAIRADGATAWNGTTLNNGNDSKGSMVWSSGSTKMAVFPRANDIGGSYVGNKQAMAIVCFETTHRNHYFIDKDAIYIAHDRDVNSTYAYNYFGVYTPISGTSPTASCVMISFGPSAGGSATAAATVFGPTTGGGGGGAFDGGISHPHNVNAKSMTYDRLSNFFSATAQPNRSNESSIYDELPLYVGMIEASSSYGLCGIIHDLFREGYGMGVHDTTTALNKVALGSANTAGSVKHILPWHTGTTPGSGVTTAGVQFSIPLRKRHKQRWPALTKDQLSTTSIRR